MIIKNLLRRKFRTGMFVVGICVILTSMQVLLGVSNGLDNQIESAFLKEQIDVVAVEANSVMVFSSTISATMLQDLSKEEGARKVIPGVLLLMQTPKFPMLIAYGLHPDRFEHKFTLLGGRYPEADDEVMIGKTIRSGFDAKVGDAIELYKKPLKVVGYFESGIETEDGSIVMTLAGAQRLSGKDDRYSVLNFSLEPGTKPEAFISRVSEKYPTLSFTTAHEYTSTQSNVQFIKGMANGVSVISIMAGAIIVFIFSLIIVQERTREIGLLRAVGWRRSRIMRLILGETLILSFLGAVSSQAVSSLIFVVMNRTPAIASMLPVRFTWQSVFITFGVAMLLGLTGGTASAYKASNLNPLDAFGRE